MAADLATVGAEFRREGACVVRGLLDDAEVARLAEGVEQNLAEPSERAIEGGGVQIPEPQLGEVRGEELEEAGHRFANGCTVVVHVRT